MRVVRSQIGRQVDHPDQLTSHRIVDRRRRARPRMHGLEHVLGREDLDRMIKRHRSADSVRSGLALRPRRALLKAHLACPLTRIAITGHPQKVRLGVGDRNDVPRILVETRKLRVDHADRRSQRRTLLRVARARWASAALVPHPGPAQPLRRGSAASCRAPAHAHHSMTPASPPSSRSWTRRSTRERATGSVVTSIATHGLRAAPGTGSSPRRSCGAHRDRSQRVAIRCLIGAGYARGEL